MRDKVKFFILPILVLILSSLSTPARSQESHKFVITILEELAGGTMVTMIEDMAEIIGKKTGTEFEVVLKPYTRGTPTLPLLKDAFEKEGAEYGVVWSEDFVRMVKKNDPNPLIIPLAVLGMDQQKDMEVCFFVRKDSDYESVADLKGTKLGTSTAGNVRLMLHDLAGHDGSIYDYFSEVRYISDSSMDNMITALVDGEIDSFNVGSTSYRMAKKGPGMKEVKTLECDDYVLNFLITASPDAPAELTSKVKKLFLSAHKNPAFNRFGFLFGAINGNFMDVSADDLERTRKITDLNEKFKWQADDDRLTSELRK